MENIDTNVMSRTRLLIVDDDEGLLKQIKWAMDSDYEVLVASNREDALKIIRESKPELIALDVNLQEIDLGSKDGIALLEEVKNNDSFSKVIMITGNDSRDIAMEAIRLGAFDYYVKPINMEELKVILKRALYIQKLERENIRLTEELQNKFTFENIVGTSPEMQEVFSLIHKVAPIDATVLITGESGTGKELVAKAIHYLSPRKDNSFIVINCGAIPENLLETELFGHEKGAFTDAYTKKIGKLEMANKGTVFLDEIGDMSLGLQVKILRFLQERVIERVGGNITIEVDVRIIVATNSDLKKKIEEDLFREDLYYRLSVVNIQLPAVRERNGDILMLAHHFLNRYKNDVSGKNIKGFTKEAKDLMTTCSWPGNVREMENRIRRAVILAQNSLITPSELGFGEEEDRDVPIEKLSLKEARRNLEETLIKRALEESKGNMSLAAKMLGVTRPTLYDLIKKYQISV